MDKIEEIIYRLEERLRYPYELKLSRQQLKLLISYLYEKHKEDNTKKLLKNI